MVFSQLIEETEKLIACFTSRKTDWSNSTSLQINKQILVY